MNSLVFWVIFGIFLGVSLCFVVLVFFRHRHPHLRPRAGEMVLLGLLLAFGSFIAALGMTMVFEIDEELEDTARMRPFAPIIRDAPMGEEE